MKRSITTTLAALIGTVMLFLPSAVTPASAAAAGFELDKTDPVATGCAGDARTVVSAPIYGYTGQIGVVELRWSERCGTNWARTTSHNGTQTITALVERTSPYAGDYFSANSTQAWTKQLYARGICAKATGGVPQWSRMFVATTQQAC